MKLFKCDLCFKTVSKELFLTELHKPYQTDEVKEVCSECLETFSDYLLIIRAMKEKETQKAVRDFIEDLYEKKNND